MEMDGKITLYDLPSATEKKAWSFNTWKTRFVLNFKQLPYKTIWVEYPDIENTLGAINMPKTGKSGTFQSVPAIADAINPTGSGPMLLADSWAIAQYLEEKYPGPTSLFHKGSASFQKAFIEQMTNELAYSLQDLMMLRSLENLNPESQPFFRETREASLCNSEHPTLESLCPKDEALANLLKTLRQNFDRFDGILAHTRGHESEGIATLPGQIVYSDLALGGILMWMKVLAPNDVWAHVETWNNGRWGKLLNALDERYGQVG